jgi:parvulin-like peptidyl-prolyl isomerase
MTIKSLALTLAIFSIPAASMANVEVAKIGSRVITQEEFNKRYEENSKYFAGRMPSKKAVMEDLIKRELGIMEAKKLGLDKDPEVQERINTVLFNSFVEKRLGKDFEKIAISDDDARSWYDRNPEVRTSHIFVSVPPGATPDAEKAALAKLQKIREDHLKPGKMSFSEIAQKYSEGIAASIGGDLDYQFKDKLDPTYYQTAVALKTVGKTSEIVRSAFGYHIVRLTGLRPWREVDKGIVKRMAFEERRQRVFDDYMAGLRKSANVTIKEELLK